VYSPAAAFCIVFVLFCFCFFAEGGLDRQGENDKDNGRYQMEARRERRAMEGFQRTPQGLGFRLPERAWTCPGRVDFVGRGFQGRLGLRSRLPCGERQQGDRRDPVHDEDEGSYSSLPKKNNEIEHQERGEADGREPSMLDSSEGAGDPRWVEWLTWVKAWLTLTTLRKSRNGGGPAAPSWLADMTKSLWARLNLDQKKRGTSTVKGTRPKAYSSEKLEDEIVQLLAADADQPKREAGVDPSPSNKPTGTASDLTGVLFTQRDVAEIKRIFGSETFFATETIPGSGFLMFRGRLRGDPEVAVQKLDERLKMRLGEKYEAYLVQERRSQAVAVCVVPNQRIFKKVGRTGRRMSLLFYSLLTWMSMVVTGLRFSPPTVSFGGNPANMMMNPQYMRIISITVCLLLFSFFVQRVVARILVSDIDDYCLIPSVGLIAGWGSRVAKSPSKRRDLFLIALFGAGLSWMLSLACFVVGLTMTGVGGSLELVPTSAVQESWLLSELTVRIVGERLPRSLLGQAVGLHPLAAAGANGLAVSAVSLLPYHFLDGGRMFRALYGGAVAQLPAAIFVMCTLGMADRGLSRVTALFVYSIIGPGRLRDVLCKNEISPPRPIWYWLWYGLMLMNIAFFLPLPSSMAKSRYSLLNAL